MWPSSGLIDVVSKSTIATQNPPAARRCPACCCSARAPCARRGNRQSARASGRAAPFAWRTSCRFPCSVSFDWKPAWQGLRSCTLFLSPAGFTGMPAQGFSATQRPATIAKGPHPKMSFPTLPQNLFEGSHPKASKRPFERLREIPSKGPKVRTSAPKSYEATLHMTLWYCASKRSEKIADLFVVLRLRFSFGSRKKKPNFRGNRNFPRSEPMCA